MRRGPGCPLSWTWFEVRMRSRRSPYGEGLWCRCWSVGINANPSMRSPGFSRAISPRPSGSRFEMTQSAPHDPLENLARRTREPSLLRVWSAGERLLTPGCAGLKTRAGSRTAREPVLISLKGYHRSGLASWNQRGLTQKGCFSPVGANCLICLPKRVPRHR